MTETIVWLVLWFVFAFAGMYASVAIFSLSGIGIAATTNTVWTAPTGVVIGYLLGFAWFVFAIIQFVLQVVALIQLIQVA